jgi:hypothetical protein
MSLIGGGSVTDGSDLPIAAGPALDPATRPVTHRRAALGMPPLAVPT